jgi:hypothetical protein
MPAAIGFDDQSGFNTSELGEIGWDRKLTAKPEAEPIATKAIP